ncbi:DUF4065 domain-containing protein [Maribacter sp. SA7]|uniref:Panacea domain-containing protein n=1 Tax=Maribacter zhoushanensis TaxID=3030012 RepID=UPI0023EBC9AC|nr:type II toxin-antitoxin system antitoxin SocA domain-containing protein [Maribacter zhoushanensis]MDF4204027.1 DUF4065 domain-containing protein [Maribacter zhoushanensis]
MYKVNQISDWILSKTNIDAGDTISPLKLQKLLYYSQAWCLTIYNGTSLFEERIEAWAHGPVVPSQYARFADIPRENSIDISKMELSIPKLDNQIDSLLNEVLDTYGEHSASYLEKLTHQESPWIIARKDLKPWERSTEEITAESMIEYYTNLKVDGE